jgi:hypothetical protein
VAKGDNKNILGSMAITPVDLRLCHWAQVLPIGLMFCHWAHVLPIGLMFCHWAHVLPIGLMFGHWAHVLPIGLMFCHGQLVGVMYCTVLYDLFRFSIQVLNFILFLIFFSNFHFGSEKNNNFMKFFWGNK